MSGLITAHALTITIEVKSIRVNKCNISQMHFKFKWA